MDEQDFLSKVNLLTHNPTLEGRLKQLVETARVFFNLDVCSLLFVPDTGDEFHIVSCREGADLVQEERGEYLCADRSESAGELAVFRWGEHAGESRGAGSTACSRAIFASRRWPALTSGRCRISRFACG